jgi:uncharacterized protein
MEPTRMPSYVAFADGRAVASGDLPTVAAAVRTLMDSSEPGTIHVFDAVTSECVDLDLRGSVADVLARLPHAESGTSADAPEPPSAAVSERRAPGRPKLGVVAREVTLLPRHWEGLASQPGGASVTLRKLVETARRDSAGEDAKRAAREAAYRFMTLVAGNEAGYEEATRALFADDRARFEASTGTWPADVRAHALTLAAVALDGE